MATERLAGFDTEISTLFSQIRDISNKHYDALRQGEQIDNSSEQIQLRLNKIKKLSQEKRMLENEFAQGEQDLADRSRIMEMMLANKAEAKYMKYKTKYLNLKNL